MDCIKYRKLISQYIDNEISNLEEEVLFKHLEECSECSLEMNNQSILSSYIKESYMVDENKTVDFSSNIMAKIISEESVNKTNNNKRNFKLIKFLKPISVAASVALVSSVIYFSIDKTKTQTIAKKKVTVDTENLEQFVLEHIDTNSVADNYPMDVSLVSYK